MDAQSDETNKPKMESASHVITAASDNDCAAMISQSEQPNVIQQQMETTNDAANSSSASANVSVTTIPETCPDDIPHPTDEPLIDVLVLSDSGQRVFKVRVSLSEFCKLPVNAIINFETNKMLSPTGGHDYSLTPHSLQCLICHH